MPPGQDPDEVIRRSPAEWKGLVANARPLLEFVISAMSAGVDAESPRGKAAIADQVSRLIFAVQDAPQQDLYFRMLAEKLEVPLDTLRASVIRQAAPQPRRGGASNATARNGAEETTASPFARLDHDPLEEYCLILLLRYPELRENVSFLSPEAFQRLENREIFVRLAQAPLGTAEQMEDGAETWKDAPLDIIGQVEVLRQKSLSPHRIPADLAMDLRKRQEAFEGVVARLEERNLRVQKLEESARTAGSTGLPSKEDLQADAALGKRLGQHLANI